jgi:hypothetical protein
MSEEYDEAQMGEEGGMPGPGAPTPLFALEVSFMCCEIQLRCWLTLIS